MTGDEIKDFCSAQKATSDSFGSGPSVHPDPFLMRRVNTPDKDEKFGMCSLKKEARPINCRILRIESGGGKSLTHLSLSAPGRIPCSVIWNPR